MTSVPAAAAPAHKIAARKIAARKIATSPRRRASTAVLIIGSVLAAAAAAGPIWVARAGVVVAVAAAVLACVLSWRELKAERRQHAAQLLAASQAHVRAMREERRHNASVLDVLTARNRRALGEIDRQQGMIAQLRGELSSLRGDLASAVSEIAQRESVIVALRETVRAREAELIALHEIGAEDDEAAAVRPMPRRVLAEHSSTATDSEPADLWSDGSHPTVVDLTIIDAVVLPNFEADRRPA